MPIIDIIYKINIIYSNIKVPPALAAYGVFTIGIKADGEDKRYRMQFFMEEKSQN